MLTGFMGSGKSDLLHRIKGLSGGHCAGSCTNKIRYFFFDLDREVVQRRHRDFKSEGIASYVNREGEEKFRRIETEVFEELLDIYLVAVAIAKAKGPRVEGEQEGEKKRDLGVEMVISLGGGTLGQGSNVALLENTKKKLSPGELSLIWLDIPFDVCFSRIGNNSQENFQAESRDRPLLSLGREKLKCLYEERKKYYSAADVVINQRQIDKLKNVDDLRLLGTIRIKK